MALCYHCQCRHRGVVLIRIFGLDVTLVKGDRGFSAIKQNAVRRPDGINPNNYAVSALEAGTALNSQAGQLDPGATG